MIKILKPIVAFSIILAVPFCSIIYTTEVSNQKEFRPIFTEPTKKEVWADIDPIETCVEKIRDSLNQQPTATHLSLSTRSLGNKILEVIGDFPNIQHLFVKENCFTDKGSKHLSRLVNIREINLSRNYISSKGLAYLPLDNLEILRINFLPLNNDNGIFLEKLETAKQLRELYIAGVEIAGESLVFLEKLTQLRVMDVSYNDFTNEEVKKLRKSLPYACVIFLEK